MKKSHIITGMIVVVTLGVTYAVYEFYVKKTLTRLSEHQAERKQLEDKIKSLEETFEKTNPEVVLSTWRGEMEPWIQAVNQRSNFFNMADMPMSTKIPEEAIPRFYYREEYPKLSDRLVNLGYRRACILQNTTFDVPTVEEISRTNPTREEVSEWLTKYKYASAMTELLIDANAREILDVSVWPPRVSANGKLEIHTTGFSFTISTMRDLVKFLEDLSISNRYFAVEALKISNQTLRAPGVPLHVELILSQARFFEKGQGGGSTAGGAPGDPGLPEFGGSGLAALSNVFGGSGLGRVKREEVPWWRKMLKRVGF